MNATEESDVVLFERRGGLGLITFNRPAVLNSLTLDMMKALDPFLDEWEADPNVGAVVVQGTGERAFCAGGDLRALFNSRSNGDRAYRSNFYIAEYSQNRHVFRYRKPYVALIDGIVMGGGVGLSVHGSHRVATERTLFAMPETGIGLFPDVGGSYFLPRLPGELGMYLGLTGVRLKAPDLIYAGIATHFVPSADLPRLIEALATTDPSAGESMVGRTIERFAREPGPALLTEHRDVIDRCFAKGSVESIVAALTAEASSWAAETVKTLSTKSPTSLKLTFRELREGRHLDFEAAMTMEYRICQFCMDGHDFFEGVRAAILDKDNAPKWDPPTLAGVTPSTLEQAFAPRPDDLHFD
ncbi:MAG TPA: enoyl-CoA hydratase/isomerase family protein [Alphaproteobacteria bacterium]|nr:enoyl-CoA hydratase/isomerase family protein [Alphaproteobacteria bacterium]